MSDPLPALNLSTAQSQASASQSFPSIVVIDAAVKSYQNLLAGPLKELEVHILSTQEDGIAQLQTLMRQYQRLSRLHLICQGAPGQMRLGTTLLSEVNLWAYADAIRQWRDCLADDAEVLIYGCDLAANRAGKAFVSWLRLLAGACIRVL
ncbi:DUF4347 domain-containing protein [Acaryochloris sp. IP29b_bin.137]|uniref:DUF4347 domain-containing protein n=1 Tax=Acaryochloris sp. IP29b_bin.137 TaxID=2969217 RepID=UPI00260F83F2|nr:DUF4347 domain-containing protein [Acaryochloris sp. IP29b_bin.137]